MARTKGKPGPKPKFGEREEIHVRVPIDDMQYIRSMTDNVTEWVIEAIRLRRAMESINTSVLPSRLELLFTSDEVRDREERPKTDAQEVPVDEITKMLSREGNPFEMPAANLTTELTVEPEVIRALREKETVEGDSQDRPTLGDSFLL